MKERIFPLNDEYTLKEINKLEDLETLRNEWDRIANKQYTYVPFLCFEWFKMSLKHFLNNHEFLVLLLYKSGDIEAIAPFLIKKQRVKGVYVRKVELIGNVYSPIKNFLFKEMDQDTRQKDVHLILSYFSQMNKDWDLVDLHSIPEEYNHFEILCEGVRENNFNCEKYSCFANWFIDSINYSSDAYFRHRSKNLRASIKKNFRNAKNKGNLEFKMITEANGIDQYINQYFEVYTKSWKEQEKIGGNYLIEWIKFAAKNGWLRLGLVFLDGVTIGAGFAILCNGYAYLAKTAYDEKYEEIGPGSIWLTEMIKYVIDIDKASVVDLLRGDEEYKRHWVNQRRERKGVLIFNNTVKAYWLSFLIQRVLPAINKNEKLRRYKEFAKRIFLSKRTMLGD